MPLVSSQRFAAVAEDGGILDSHRLLELKRPSSAVWTDYQLRS